MKYGQENPSLMVLTASLGGGTGNHSVPLFNRMMDSGWHTEILTSKPSVARTKLHPTVKTLPPVRWLGPYPQGRFRRLAFIRNHLLRQSPDIVHTYFLSSIMYGRLFKQLGLIRFLVENREDLGFAWGRAKYSLLRLTGKIPDRVICVSEAVQRVALKREGLDASRTVVIHNGIDKPAEYTEDERRSLRKEGKRMLGLKENHLVVGMVAALLRPVKGVRYYIDAIPAILKEVPSARFIIIGSGEKEPEYRARARGLGLGGVLHFLGRRDDMDRIYMAMDIFALTSLSEGFSIAILEAMSHRLPVVVTNVGGNSEVVVDGENGFLVPPSNVPAFVRKVVLLLSDESLRAELGRHGSRTVADKFTLEKTFNQYREVYRGLLGRSEDRKLRR